MDKQIIDELTLILMYLTSWKDDNRFSNENDLYAWKGYNFDSLNNLEESDYIRQGSHPSRTKSVYLTEEGRLKAKELIEKYNIK